MTRIGVVGLDTSHGEAFADVLRERRQDGGASSAGDDGAGATITTVWDGGAVRDDGYVASFCRDWEATRYDDPGEMVEDVDAAMVLAVDWERHCSLARPFLEAGVPTLVDKPIAGSVADLDALASAADGTPLFGGSAVPFHPAFQALADRPGGGTLHVAGYNDFFYYRAHVVDAARRIAGANWERVTPVEETATTTVGASFADGTWATLRFDAPADDPVYGALSVADATRTAEVAVDEAALDRMYEPYLDEFLRVARGTAPDPTDAVLDAGRLLLAVEAALALGRPVSRDDPALAEATQSSDSFLADYEPYY